MKYLLLYLLVGAIVAVWSALNNVGRSVEEPELPPRIRAVSVLSAYALVALLWPLSLALSIYAIVVGLSNREGPERGR
jgi:hypothetical protein